MVSPLMLSSAAGKNKDFSLVMYATFSCFSCGPIIVAVLSTGKSSFSSIVSVLVSVGVVKLTLSSYFSATDTFLVWSPKVTVNTLLFVS